MQTFFTLTNPHNGNLAFKIYSFDDGSQFDHIQRLNYYSLVLLTGGKGILKVDFSEYEIHKEMLLCFSPYQPFMFAEASGLTGTVINFHPDFFCIHKHHKEVACNGVLFNNIYEAPFLHVTQNELKELLAIVNELKVEMKDTSLAQHDILISYLKIILIKASRIKKEQLDKDQEPESGTEPFVVQQLKESIETHYKTKHTASDYADLLNTSYSTLAKVSKNYFNKTLTDLISERIIIEAKRELYLTSKAIKRIAYDLGFNDEYYFSRFFKKNADVSPQQYRETVGFARQELNN
ncbi:helix-turn-helix transcriptional regulator [Aliifodinibius sp. S!AR15-10]|uniref:helix-turn-helix domain-containing protein n=1 Tax=Aliifodinibius sp. S!AR15-10 TaxID=2950437 RepID=UPI0028581BC6|nr:helix-turn-helix domain-containing protein [Aliifodinibius sp. S!AR15-10]MDR8389562.1 helix-turn-helix transcriptional regulator [Aliifodinibius sp. S!AR15-10]